MTITTAAEYMRSGHHREALGSIPVKCPNGCRDFLLANSACQGSKGWDKWRCDYAIDPRTILVTDEAGEVGEMCEVEMLTAEGLPVMRSLASNSDLPITARIYLWDGSPVDWEADNLTKIRARAGDMLLTAVVLVGDRCPLCCGTGVVGDDGEKGIATTCDCDGERFAVSVMAAESACASAGVQWIDKEGVLEL